jgi:hypothetical protein
MVYLTLLIEIWIGPSGIGQENELPLEKETLE